MNHARSVGNESRDRVRHFAPTNQEQLILRDRSDNAVVVTICCQHWRPTTWPPLLHRSAYQYAFGRVNWDVSKYLIMAAHSNGQAIIFLSYGFFLSSVFFLWPPCVADADIIFMVALCNRADHYIFALWFLSSSFFFFFFFFFFFSSPNLSGRRLDVYHTSTHGVALVRI